MSDHYFSSASITDSIVREFASHNDSRVTAWLNEVDNEIEALALERGVYIESIVVPIHPRLTDYANNFYCMIVCRDAIGTNDPEVPTEDKYLIKFNIYSGMVSNIRQTLSKEMFLGFINTPGPMNSGGIRLFRS